MHSGGVWAGNAGKGGRLNDQGGGERGGGPGKTEGAAQGMLQPRGGQTQPIQTGTRSWGFVLIEGGGIRRIGHFKEISFGGEKMKNTRGKVRRISS